MAVATHKRSVLRDNGLTIVLVGLFLASAAGHIGFGYLHENEQRLMDGGVPIVVADYVASGSFLSTLFENWESEFLQMWAYVMLTAYLFQRGSPESRDPDSDETRAGESDARPRTLKMFLREHSLGFALLGLFLLSFLLHWTNSARDAAGKAVENGRPPPDMFAHLSSAQLWFESFQNWQSEFMSTAVLVVLGIFLRERLSPESKAVGDPNSKTGA